MATPRSGNRTNAGLVETSHLQPGHHRRDESKGERCRVSAARTNLVCAFSCRSEGRVRVTRAIVPHYHLEVARPSLLVTLKQPIWQFVLWTLEATRYR